MSAKQLGGILALVFAVALAIVVGSRMSNEAMAVVIGVVCGVASAIPTTVLLMVVLNRRERQIADEADRRARQSAQPPVIVIQGGTPQHARPGLEAAYWPGPETPQVANRSFRLVGGDDLLLEDRSQPGYHHGRLL